MSRAREGSPCRLDRECARGGTLAVSWPKARQADDHPPAEPPDRRPPSRSPVVLSQAEVCLGNQRVEVSTVAAAGSAAGTGDPKRTSGARHPQRPEGGLAVASVIRWHDRPLWSFSENEIGCARISMMARNANVPSRAGYRSARPITSKSSLSACNARPVHTEVPFADIPCYRIHLGDVAYKGPTATCRAAGQG